MTLEETWRLCLSMWRWIAKEKRAGNKREVESLKMEWLDNHGYDEDGLWCDCFFCDYAYYRKEDMCGSCPVRMVDKNFDCHKEDYNYEKKPVKFYNKLVALNKKRLKGKK